MPGSCWNSCGELALAGSQAPYPAASLAPGRTGEKAGGKRARKLMGQNIDREITYQVLLWAKQTQLTEFNLA